MSTGKIYSIQVGYGRSSYRPRINYVGNLNAAMKAYNDFHLHKGMKKRLVAITDNIVLCKDESK